MDASGVILLLLIIAVAVWFLGRGRGAGGPGGRRAADPLITACGGDARKAERLAAHEQQREPGLSREEARQRALERLQRDR